MSRKSLVSQNHLSKKLLIVKLFFWQLQPHVTENKNTCMWFNKNTCNGRYVHSCYPPSSNSPSLPTFLSFPPSHLTHLNVATYPPQTQTIVQGYKMLCCKEKATYTCVAVFIMLLHIWTALSCLKCSSRNFIEGGAYMHYVDL